MATRTIETKIVLGGEKEFNAAMKTLNNNMKNLTAEMKAVTSEFDENASAADKLKARQDLLNQQIEQQKEIVRVLGERYEQNRKELGENAAATDKYRQAMLNAQSKLNNFKKELSEVDRELEDVAKETDKAGDEAQKAAPKFEKSAEGLSKIWSYGEKAGSALMTLTKASLSASLNVAKIGLKSTAIGIAGLGVASGGAAAAITALSVKGLKLLGSYAVQAAQSGNPAFKGLADNLKDLSTVSEAAKASLGKVLLPELESFTDKATLLLNAFSEEMTATGGDTKLMGDVIARYIRQAAELIRVEAPAFIKAGGGLISGFTEGVIENAEGIEAAADEVIGLLADYLSENADQMGEAAAVLVSVFGSLILDNAPQLMQAGIAMVRSLTENMDGQAMGEKAAELVLDLLFELLRLAPDLAEAGLAFVGGIINGVVGKWPELVTTFTDAKNELVATAKEWWTDWHGAGAEWMKGLLAGLKEWWAGIVEWWNGVRNSLAPATIGYTGSMGSVGGNSMGNRPRNAAGMDVVPSDWYPVYADKDEMILKAPLARELRAMGVTNASSSVLGALERAIGSTGNGDVNIQNEVIVRFTGSLAALARVLQPEIEVVSHNKGPRMSGV